MALPELIKAQVEKKLGKLCEDRIPEHVKDKVNLTYKIRGDAVTLLERRFIPMRETWIEMPIAKIKYDRDDSGKWFLFMANRNDKWFNYFEYWNDSKKARTLDKVIEEIDKDPKGVFWG